MRTETIQTAEHYREAVIGRLATERAENLSDEEIDRCTKRCVSARVASWAKLLRDAGRLTMSDILDATDSAS